MKKESIIIILGKKREVMNMKAAIYMGKEKVEIRDIELPHCGDDDVIVKNIYSSICGTDVAVYKKGPNTGHRITVGEEFGHETVSRVVAIGKNITEFKIGDRVYPYPLYAKNNTRKAGTIGGFSEYILIPKAKKNHSLYDVPDRITDRVACLIEPFTVGCRAARRSNPNVGEKAIVFGCGTIGLAASIALKYFGIDKVMICDLSDFRLNIAKKLGFVTCNTKREDLSKKAKEFFGIAPSLVGETMDVDIFIDAAGAESILNIFMEKGKISSRFVSVAVNNSVRQLDLLHMTYAQKSIIGSGGYMPEDVRDVMNIMSSNKWNIEQMITHEFSIDEINKAIMTASDSTSALNVTIKF